MNEITTLVDIAQGKFTESIYSNFYYILIKLPTIDKLIVELLIDGLSIHEVAGVLKSSPKRINNRISKIKRFFINGGTVTRVDNKTKLLNPTCYKCKSSLVAYTYSLMRCPKCKVKVPIRYLYR